MRSLSIVLALTVLASLAAAAHISDPSTSDISRAHTKIPRDEYRADSRIGMPITLNSHLAKTEGLTTAPCHKFSLGEVIDVKRTIYGARSPALEEIYNNTADNRRLGTFGRFTSTIEELEDLWSEAAGTIDGSPELHDHARDAMCREAVMWWVHHTSDAAKSELKQFVTLPLLPEASTSTPIVANSAATQRVTEAAAQSNLCFQCHHANVPVPPPAPCTGSPLPNGECPVWPKEFSVPFTLYSGFPMPHLEASPSVMYYKFQNGVKAQMLDYQKNCFPGAALKGGNFKHPCKLLFDETGIYLSQPSRGTQCCKFTDGVGAVPPEFLNSFKYEKNETVPDMYGNQVDSHYWSGPGGFGYWTAAHAYTGVDGSSFPANHDVKFKDGPTGITWRFGKFDLSAQDDALFQQSTYGTPEQCATDCSIFMSRQEKELAMRAPEIRNYMRHQAATAQVKPLDEE